MAITTATQAAEIMNQSLADLGYDFQIDTTSGATIEQGFKAVGAYGEDQKNELLKQANIILVFRNYGTMFNESKNPTRRFWREDMIYGGGIEDIYHEIITPVEGFWAEDYASAANDDELALNIARDLVKYHDSDVKKKFHTKIDRFTIPLSLTELEISKIFTAEGFARYVDVKMANIQWSAEVKLQNIVIEAVRKMVTDNKVHIESGFDINTADGVTDIVERIQTVTDEMTNLSNTYNDDDVLTISDEEDLFLFTTSEFINRLRVRGYANAYNLKEYALKNRVIILPKGTTFGNDSEGNPVHAILMDRRNIVLSIRYWKMRTFLPGNTDYNNYFLKVQYLHGYNTFFNACGFSGESFVNFINATSLVPPTVATISFGAGVSGSLYVNGVKVIETLSENSLYTAKVGDLIEISDTNNYNVYGGYVTDVSQMVSIENDGTGVSVNADYPIMYIVKEG